MNRMQPTTPMFMPPIPPNNMFATQTNQPPQQMLPMPPGSNRNFAEKLSATVPPYIMKRIFANIDKIQNLVMGGEWNTEDFKSSLKNEIDALAKNLEDPVLIVAIKDLTDAADVPLTLFVREFTLIIQKHINDIIYKLTSMAGNLVGEIPGVNVISNSILAASNAVHVAKNVTELGKELVESVQTFKNEMTSVMDKFNPSMNQQFGPQLMGQQMMPPLMAQPVGPQMMSPLMAQPVGPQLMGQQMMPQFSQPLMSQKQNGGSKTGGPHNVKEAKKHLHQLHRKKNRTLRRINDSIHDFLTSNRNKRSIKAKRK